MMDILSDIIRAVVLLFGFTVSGTLFFVASKIARADRADYKMNKRRSGRFRDAIRGNLRPRQNGQTDYNVAAGLAIRDNKWIEQGKLSDEAIDNILQHREN